MHDLNGYLKEIKETKQILNSKNNEKEDILKRIQILQEKILLLDSEKNSLSNKLTTLTSELTEHQKSSSYFDFLTLKERHEGRNRNQVDYQTARDIILHGGIIVKKFKLTGSFSSAYTRESFSMVDGKIHAFRTTYLHKINIPIIFTNINKFFDEYIVPDENYNYFAYFPKTL